MSNYDTSLKTTNLIRHVFEFVFLGTVYLHYTVENKQDIFRISNKQLVEYCLDMISIVEATLWSTSTTTWVDSQGL